ncbi:isocitrate lyase/phosphoenolpyruvate mutase family protein [Amycolatopsis rhabdoformis]|uniref:Isocitrate lyase/phosphoenolpyruvate mutase family protein n=1 Tax=Amycolatopsis rhabdoformis TaxID=1448059 RepID=A0ABZ1HYA7_9PSEU|nr:isocitrate lyase/phosphoenolpyruvate mutase family protein [Amycolatopsis rhabdoformis]WSE26501.1 isocitrate lyase/phosphoenolpyruvate mutase family protein [Amycolatopsis rhabdoformis]
MESLRDKAKAFRALHAQPMVVLPNAWDAGSAAVLEHAGAPAVATTSGGVSWARGHGDGQGLSRAEMTEAIRQITAAVSVPVSADIEGGYGPDPGDVAATVTEVLGAGAVGVNLEDSRAGTLTLFSPSEQAARLAAARSAADEAGLPELWINARTDVFLFGVGEPSGRLADVLSRATAYAEAGVDSIFVPGLVDLEALGELTAASPIPVAVMAWAGAPSVAEFAAAGVRRVTVGTALAQAAYGVALRATQEMLTGGTYDELSSAMDFGALNGLFG